MFNLMNGTLLLYGIYLLSELINYTLLSFIQLPSSVLGMGMLFILMERNIIKSKNINPLSNLLLKHMAFFFIPLGVGLMTTLDIINDIWLYLIIILIVSNIIVMYISGKTVDLFLTKRKVK